MGNFYVNFTTRGVKREVIVKYLEAAKRIAFVGPTVAGTTVFFDEKSDSQDDAEIKTFGKRTSKNIGTPVLAVLNHDDDLLCYWLFKDGKVIDQYNSCPAYFDDEEEERPSGGDAKVLCKAFGVVAKATQVEKVLRREEYVFAFERHKELAKLLKHPWQYVSMGYEYITDGALSKGVTQKSLLEIGPVATNQAYIEKAIADLLKPLGFRKQKNYWFLDLGDTVAAIIVSNRGPLRNVGFGIWFKQFGKFAQPSNGDFHYGAHAMDVNRKYHTRAKCWDYADKTLSPEKKIAEIGKFFSNEFIPFVLKFDSLDSVCKFGESTSFSVAFPRQLWDYYENVWKPGKVKELKSKKRNARSRRGAASSK